jgi:hypothetical protein
VKAPGAVRVAKFLTDAAQQVEQLRLTEALAGVEARLQAFPRNDSFRQRPCHAQPSPQP